MASLRLFVSWENIEVGDVESNFELANEYTEKFMELNAKIIEELKTALGNPYTEGPYAGEWEDTWAYFEANDPETIEAVKDFVLEYWGFSDGGDLSTHGVFSSEVETLIGELERFWGEDEYGDPHFMFRIQMDMIRIDDEVQEFDFNPTHDDQDEFIETYNMVFN